MDAPKPLSRSDREARIKDKAGLVITFFAALLAINTYIANSYSSKILTNTLMTSNNWAFYQSKSIKQSIAEGQLYQAKLDNNKDLIKELEAKIKRYDSEPDKGEGKKELLEKGRKLESEREEMRKHTPWLTFSNMAFQLSIVLLSASILAVSMPMFYLSIVVGFVGSFLMSQGIWLWF